MPVCGNVGSLTCAGFMSRKSSLEMHFKEAIKSSLLDVYAEKPGNSAMQQVTV